MMTYCKHVRIEHFPDPDQQRYADPPPPGLGSGTHICEHTDVWKATSFILLLIRKLGCCPLIAPSKF